MSSTSLKPYVPADEYVKDDFTGEVDPEETFWQAYLNASREEDEAQPKDWEGDTGSILTFVRVLSYRPRPYL